MIFVTDIRNPPDLIKLKDTIKEITSKTIVCLSAIEKERLADDTFSPGNILITMDDPLDPSYLNDLFMEKETPVICTLAYNEPNLKFQKDAKLLSDVHLICHPLNNSVALLRAAITSAEKFKKVA